MAGSGIQGMLVANVGLQDAESTELVSAKFSAEHDRDSTTKIRTVAADKPTWTNFILRIYERNQALVDSKRYS